MLSWDDYDEDGAQPEPTKQPAAPESAAVTPEPAPLPAEPVVTAPEPSATIQTSRSGEGSHSDGSAAEGEMLVPPITVSEPAVTSWAPAVRRPRRSHPSSASISLLHSLRGGSLCH